MPDLWIPGAAGPSVEDFVGRVHRTIEQYATRRGIERPYVEVLLHDGTRLGVHSLRPDPGYGFLTICPFPEDGPPPTANDDCPPEELIVPVGSIVRLRLSDAPELEPGLGFSVPSA